MKQNPKLGSSLDHGISQTLIFPINPNYGFHPLGVLLTLFHWYTVIPWCVCFTWLAKIHSSPTCSRGFFGLIDLHLMALQVHPLPLSCHVCLVHGSLPNPYFMVHLWFVHMPISSCNFIVHRFMLRPKFIYALYHPSFPLVWFWSTHNSFISFGSC